MDKLTAFLGGVALFVLAVILRGWVLSILWKWFVVPLGVAKIGIAWAIGIAMVVGMLAKDSNDKVTTDTFMEKLGIAALAPLVVLLMGLTTVVKTS